MSFNSGLGLRGDHGSHLYNSVYEVVKSSVSIASSALDSIPPVVINDPSLLKVGFGAGMVFLGSAGLVKSGVGRDLQNYFSGNQTEKAEHETMSSKASRYGVAAISAVGIGVGIMAIGLGVSEKWAAPGIEVVPADPRNLCKSEPRLCECHLNIPRKEMPQIDGPVKTEYIDWWPSDGTKVLWREVNASKLTSTQSEINQDKGSGHAGFLRM